jgi:hypothetical protein
MLKELVEKLLDTGRELSGIETVFEDSIRIVKRVNGEIRQYAVEDRRQVHSFGSLEGLLAFVNSAHCGWPGVIMVNEKGIFVDPSYETNRDDRLTMPATFSDAYKALGKLAQGIGQRNLWRLLVTDLAEAIRPAGKLLSFIQGVNIRAESKNEVTISAAGETDQSGGSVLTVTYPGKGGASAEARIDVEWTWRGRIWDTFAKEYEIPLRLEIVPGSEGVLFTFHPRCLSDVLRRMRLDLVAEIAEKIPKHYSVYEGEL